MGGVPDLGQNRLGELLYARHEFERCAMLEGLIVGANMQAHYFKNRQRDSMFLRVRSVTTRHQTELID